MEIAFDNRSDQCLRAAQVLHMSLPVVRDL